MRWFFSWAEQKTKVEWRLTTAVDMLSADFDFDYELYFYSHLYHYYICEKSFLFFTDASVIIIMLSYLIVKLHYS